MPAKKSNSPEQRVFLLTHIGNDARNAAAVLDKVNIPNRICAGMGELCDHAAEQAGALVIAQETLNQASLDLLLAFLVRQPAWSDIPIILLTAAGEIRQSTYNILDFLGARANVTLLEKPLRAITLVSITRTALRARSRQHEVRKLLERYHLAVEESQMATAKFQAVFEQSPVFAGIVTLDGKVTEANRLWVEMSGYKVEEVVGKFFWECGWWRGSKEVQDKIRAGVVQAAKGVPFAEILPYLWANGTERLVEFVLHPIRDDSGQIIYLHPTGLDITARLQGRARADFLSQLTQKLSIVSDPTEINRIATREIGQFMGAHRCYFFQPDAEVSAAQMLPNWRRDAGATLEGTYSLDNFGPPQMWQANRTGALSVDDVREHPWTKQFLSSYEKLSIMAFHQTPFIRAGNWVACLAVSSDQPRHWTPDEQSLLENAIARVWPLIERARAEKALRIANALLADKASHFEELVKQRTSKLQETVGELEAFSYSIAHDMRAPLRSLQSFSGILLSDYSPKLDAEGQDFLRRIAKSANRMDRLIQDVLNYSKVVRSELALEKVDVEQLLHGIMDTYPMLAPDKAEVIVEGPFPPILGNEAMLTQIFSNLMGNGIKFMAPGVKPVLKLWAEPRGRAVRLFVKDNGIGIEQDQHEKIFGMFQQVSKTYEGTGIGLAIVKKAVERMGGTVGIQSQPGEGSTFWIDVQAAPSQNGSGQ